MESTKEQNLLKENVQTKRITEDAELNEDQLEAVAGGGIIGALIGGAIGSIGGPLGAVGGAIIGHQIEEALK